MHSCRRARWRATAPTRRGATSRRGDDSRSNDASVAASTAATSRLPIASVSANDGHLAERDDELTHRLPVDRLAAGPRRELRDLVREMVQVGLEPLGHDRVDERPRELAVDPLTVRRELLDDPLDDLLAVDVVDEHLAELRDRLQERGVLAELARRRARARLPASGRPRTPRSPSRPRPSSRSTSSTTTSRSVPKSPSEFDAATASSPDVSSAAEQLDAVGVEAVAEPAERALDLRPVRAGQEVERLELVGHEASLLSASAPDPEPRAVGLDDDAAVEVGSVEPQARRAARAPRASTESGGRSRCRARPR